MNFEIQTVSTVRLLSKDIGRSRQFYKALFNQDPIEDTDVFVSFKLGNCVLDIASEDEKNPFSIGGSVSYWLVDNVESLLEEAVKLGATLYRGPLKVAETQRIILQIQDPAGNIIGFEAPI